MAKEDDLSVNINVGVELDKASFKEAKDELEFLVELQKELGVEGVSKVRVGGYSTGNSPDKVSRNKAASQFEKMGGDWTGVDIADKAQAELAKQFNQASKELAKLFNIDFIPDAAAALGQMDFSMPDPEKIFNTSGTAKEYNDKLQKATEDFFMDALGEVTISPAMFLAAAEKVIKNNPDLYMPRGMKDVKSLSWMQTGGQISPTSIFAGKQPLEANPAQVATFDKIRSEKIAQVGGEKMADAFSYAIEKDLDEIVIGAWEKASKEVASNKDIKQILKDDPTFSISGIAASDAFANLEIYFMERFIENVKQGESEKGYQTSSFASNIGNIRSASRGDTLLNFPDDPMNVLPKDKIINWLNTMIEDGVMHPLQQVFENPGILGKAFISNSESSVRGGFTRLLNASSGEATLSKKGQEEKKYHDQLMAQSKELGDMAKWLDSRVTNVAQELENFQKGNIPQISKSTELKAESGDFAKDFYNAMRGGEFEAFKGELKSNLQDYEKEQNALKDIKRFGPMTGSSTNLMEGYNSASPDLAKLEEFLKMVTKGGAAGSYAGIDTEHFNTVKDGVTELGVVIENGAGNLVEIFKLIQIPTDIKQMAESWDKLNSGKPSLAATQAKTPEDLANRAAKIGVPIDKIGSATDPERNIKAAVESYTTLSKILELFAKYNVTLTGVSVQSADITPIKKTIDYLNSISGNLGAGQIPEPNFGVPFDPSKYTKQLANPEFANQANSDVLLSEVFRVNGKESAALGNLIQRISQTEPAWLKQFESQFTTKQTKAGGVTFDYKPQGGTEAGAHFAISDAAASVIALKFIEKFGSDAARDLLTPVAKNANIELEKQNRAAITSSAGGGSGQPPLASSAGKDDPMDRDPSQVTSRIVLTAKEFNRSLESIAGSMDVLGKQSFPVLEKMTEAELAAFNKRIAKSTTHLQIITDLTTKEDELAKSRAELKLLTQGDAGFTLARRSQGLQGPQTKNQALFESQGGIKRFDDQAKAAAKLKLEVNDLTQSARQYEIQTAKNVVEELRKGQVTEQLTENLRKQVDAQIENTQAGKTATSQIKAQMQEQVNAQKEVQKQTQSLMNTWVTSRYALYDVGNFYANFSQQLFRLTRQIFDTTNSYRRFQTAFTSVERAMQLPRDAADDLRQQFILLSETIPVSFEDISKIATLGAQMGITARGIVGFTETVAQFASVTGISAETVAQQFGRIAELADVDSSEFVNLGSAVSYAGVNAVATESEILTLSQSIAAVSNQVGITAPEIIGLGTALASVGIPAEQARGVFTRVFADIDRAANTGGKSLQNLAAVTGMSAEQIQGSWGKEGAANEVFLALLQGLDASENLTATFDSLNIVETREINTLTRLAKNMNVVQQALGDSGMAYEDASFLGESFGKTVDNLDSKILIFKNNLDSLLSTFSQGFVPTMEFVLDAGSGFLKFLKSLEDSWLLKGVLPAAAVFIALGGVLAGTGAILTKLTAQVYAFRVAMINTANNPTTISGFPAQVRALTGLGSAVFELRKNVEGINTRGLIEPMDLTGKDAPSMFAGEEKQNAYLLKERNLYVAVGKAVRDTNQVKELERTGKLTDIQLARLEADQVNKAISARRLQIEQLENSASAYDAVNKKSVPSAANLQGQKLRNNYEQMYVAIVRGEVVTISAANKAALERILIREHSTAATKKEAAAILASTTAVNLQTTAATRAMNGIGAFVSKAFTFVAIAGTIITVVNAIATAIGNLNKIDLLESGGGLESFREAIRQDTKDLASGEMLPSEVITTATVEQKTYKQVVDDSASSIGDFTDVSREFTDGFKTTTEEIKKQTVALGTNTKEWLANAIFQNEKLQEWVDSNPDIFNQMQESMSSMGITFDQLISDIVAKSEGADVDPLKEVNSSLTETKNRIQELSAINPYAMTDEQREELRLLYEKSDILQKIIVFINSMGGALTGALDMQTLKDAIRGAFGLGNELEDVEDTVGGVAAAVRTVIDYASDLAGIFSRAFEIRFGQQQSLDDIASGWATITEQTESAADAIKSAEDAIRSANNEIGELTADKSILEYQLSVAERYGDEKRVALIRAKLAKVSNSMAKANENVTDANKDLADATADASKETDGNSKAAINNRKALMSQLSSYAALVEMYAKTGLQGDALTNKVNELKNSFLAQGIQAGFSNAQLQPYISSFDDMRETIQKTPRNVTVEFDSNVSAATQALNEYLAKLDKASGTFTSKIDVILPEPGSLKMIIDPSDLRLYRMAADLPSTHKGHLTQAQFYKAVYGIDLTTVGRADGGIVLGPGSSTSDSIPAMLSNGEYVVRASAVNNYGLDFMNALNQQKVGFNPTSQSVSVNSSSTSSVVYLSPEDRALLRSVVDRPIALYTENSKIAQSANAGNVLLAQRGSN